MGSTHVKKRPWRPGPPPARPLQSQPALLKPYVNCAFLWTLHGWKCGVCTLQHHVCKIHPWPCMWWQVAHFYYWWYASVCIYYNFFLHSAVEDCLDDSSLGLLQILFYEPCRMCHSVNAWTHFRVLSAREKNGWITRQLQRIVVHRAAG